MTQTPQEKQKQPTRWLVPFPEKKAVTGHPCRDACNNNAKQGELLLYFLQESSWELDRQGLDESCKVVKFTRSHKDILKRVNISEKTLIQFLKQFNTWGFVLSESYGKVFTVQAEPIYQAMYFPVFTKKIRQKSLPSTSEEATTSNAAQESCNVYLLQQRVEALEQVQLYNIALEARVQALSEALEQESCKVVKLQKKVEASKLYNSAPNTWIEAVSQALQIPVPIDSSREEESIDYSREKERAIALMPLPIFAEDGDTFIEDLLSPTPEEVVDLLEDVKEGYKRVTDKHKALSLVAVTADTAVSSGNTASDVPIASRDYVTSDTESHSHISSDVTQATEPMSSGVESSGYVKDPAQEVIASKSGSADVPPTSEAPRQSHDALSVPTTGTSSPPSASGPLPAKDTASALPASTVLTPGASRTQRAAGAGSKGKGKQQQTDVLLEAPLQEPDMHGPWNNEKVVQYTEWCNEQRYRESERNRQLKAAKDIHQDDSSLTLEQYKQAYDERNDEWWQKEQGKLHVTHMKGKERNSGIDRMHAMLDRISARNKVKSNGKEQQNSSHKRASSPHMETDPASFISKTLDTERNDQRIKAMMEKSAQIRAERSAAQQAAAAPTPVYGYRC